MLVRYACICRQNVSLGHQTYFSPLLFTCQYTFPLLRMWRDIIWRLGLRPGHFGVLEMTSRHN